MTPLILWFRRDLRLDDNPMLAAAAATGRPLIPVFIADGSVTGIGAAARWRMGEAVESFGTRLAGQGSRMILRRGPALPVLLELISQTGASGVWWTRLYDPFSRERDTDIKDYLKSQGLEARSFHGHTLAEPWDVATQTGGPYKVYTPFWKSLDAQGVAEAVPAPERLVAPSDWPGSEALAGWRLGAAMNRGAPVLASHAVVGEAAAQARLDRFLAETVQNYRTDRDFPALKAVSGLSENLTYGEIGPRRIWHAAKALPGEGATHFRKELAWRDFAHHLMFHTPHLLDSNWRDEWNGFAWQGDTESAERWRRGLTGEPFVDAGLREMFVTGTMHNRVRMIVASYLTKHLMTDWKIGMDWFAECLTDWDPASNAMGWQWVAGSGPDAAPYFRVFNPATQAEKFDKTATYRKTFIAELSAKPGATALSYFDAVPRSWGLDPAKPYPDPLISLSDGRERALAAYESLRKG
ncbi:cryptochrome/photolyase family protein [Pararhodobacter zhoushanensis]|uniref:cryptochrome/photolyase family protein n=1 Tax=Pararhodobacter zhoushanensis TaxID=2479545 RepID=UPI000F8E9F3A|nr:deoxyribodipyrimidine photo-lyase [Pararhodobacter zhoushanensis]